MAIVELISLVYTKNSLNILKAPPFLSSLYRQTGEKQFVWLTLMYKNKKLTLYKQTFNLTQNYSFIKIIIIICNYAA